MTERGRDMAIESLQLITLLLHPDLRRKLHLLLRFMAKVSANPKLCLDDNVSTKMLVCYYKLLIFFHNHINYCSLFIQIVYFFSDD